MNDWQVRDDATVIGHLHDLETRTLSVRASTANEEDRSVEAVLSTDSAVEVYDWRSGDTIDEVLLSDAVELPEQLPLLAAHSRWSLDDVLGSVRSLTTEESDGHYAIVGRLFFTSGDPDADRAWAKVSQGHLTDVSVGYRVQKSTEIEKGQSAVVGGREFTAANRRLRVVTEWVLREASLVPIGADRKAKTRADQPNNGGPTMRPELREYLETIGLRAEATDAEAWQFLAGLEGEQHERACEIMLEQQRGDAGNQGDDGHDEGDDDNGRSGDDVLAAERSRIARIQELARTDVPRDVVDQAIRDGWDESRASQAFLEAVRGQRMRQDSQPPGGHSRSSETRRTANSLAAGMLIGSGLDPVGVRMHDGRHARRADAITERDADFGDEYRQLSAIDLVRECVRLDTGRDISNPEEAIRAAVSGTSLSRVFTTNMYASLMAGWDETPDTTGWCQVEDAPNFLTQENVTLNAQAYPDRHPRGATAKHATAEDEYEQYKIYRFSKQFVADEQDIIDDRLGALTQMAREMGEAARRVRPDLVYAILLANAAMTDTGNLFNATATTTAGGHANYTTAVLGSAGLKAGITAMGKIRIGEKVLNIRPKFLIVPVDLQWTAKELLNSGELRDTTANTNFMTKNVLAGENLTLVVDDRVGAAGCSDPVSGTAYTGAATYWYLAANQRTVKVVYRRGTGRSPQMRSFNLTQGQWGVGWDISLDIGAKAIDWRGLHWSAGTG